MAQPIIKIKRGGAAPTITLNAGEFAIDQAAKNLYLGVEVGGVTTNEIVGGSGTFATKTYVGDAITAATGSLGTMATQNADSVAITGGDISNVTGAFTTLTASSAPSALNEVVRKTDLDSAVSALGSVFHYVGDVSSASTPLNLNTLSDTTTGAYYKVDVAGTYTSGASSFAAKVGDAFVKTSTGWQKLDNVDVEVLGTANEIIVTGDENAGYTVSIHTNFSNRVDSLEISRTDLETKTQNIDLSTSPNDTKLNGRLEIISDTEANQKLLLNIDSSSTSGGGSSSAFNIESNVRTLILKPDNLGDNLNEYNYHESQGIGGGSGYEPEVRIEALITRVAGNLVGNGTTSQILDFIIDGGEY